MLYIRVLPLLKHRTERSDTADAAVPATLARELQFGQQGVCVSNKKLLTGLTCVILLTVGICGFCRASRCVFPMYESVFSTNMVTTPSAVMMTTKGSATEQCTMGEPRSTGMKWSCVTESKIESKHVRLLLCLIPLNLPHILLYSYYNKQICFILFNQIFILFTSFQEPNTHGGDLDDVLVVTDVSSKHSGSLGGKTTGVQLHDLLTCLKDLHKNRFSLATLESNTIKLLCTRIKTVPLCICSYHGRILSAQNEKAVLLRIILHLRFCLLLVLFLLLVLLSLLAILTGLRLCPVL